MPEMVAKVEHWYGGSVRTPGERFHVEPNHVLLQKALGRAEVAQGSEDTYRTTHIEASGKNKRQRARS